ncbi:unnamed protein product [Auanema sp. JU1783]|nr:unnamed protein product [Auanema sp. JU1783]
MRSSGYVPYTLYPPTKQTAIRCVQRNSEVRSNPHVVTYVYSDEGSASVPLLKAFPPLEFEDNKPNVIDNSVLDDSLDNEEKLLQSELVHVDEKCVPQAAAFEEVAEPSCSNATGDMTGFRKYPKTYVEHNRRWTYKSEASVANADEDGQLYYNPDPYRPAPPAKGAPSTLARMHYAAQRIDNRKYRGQRTKARATNQMESASCDRCKMRFFLPYNHFRSHISYAISSNRYALPLTFFNCPVCRTDTQIFM